MAMSGSKEFKRRPTATPTASGDVVVFLSDTRPNVCSGLSPNAIRNKKIAPYQYVTIILLGIFLPYTLYQVYSIVRMHHPSNGLLTSHSTPSRVAQHKVSGDSASYDGTHQGGLDNYEGNSPQGKSGLPSWMSAR
eukprot:5641574-Pyramimonas_sp.AAC.1